MKAIRIHSPASLDNLHYIEAPDPARPGPGEIQVRLRASSLNNHDLMVATGKIPTAEGRIPLSDGAGEVVAVGEGVAEFAAGDLVISTFFPVMPDKRRPQEVFRPVPGDGSNGFACELATRPVNAFTRAPEGWSAAEAATISCAGLTAWRALMIDGQLKPGETVLVQGTGGVSLYALQLAKAAGCEVVATSSSDEKLERLRALGADHLINYKDNPDWGVAARELTGGRGVDHVVEIGGAGTLPQSLTACAFGGHIAVIGALSGYAGEIPTVLVMARELRVMGLLVGSRAQQLDLVRALESTRIKPVIDRHFPLASLADAFRYQESRRHLGKIVVDI
jgi:NADPH:quinone reductase-like Zn-dependent oxidoreductase